MKTYYLVLVYFPDVEHIALRGQFRKRKDALNLYRRLKRMGVACMTRTVKFPVEEKENVPPVDRCE